MKFKWNDDKNRVNYEKHHVLFEQAQTLWMSNLSVEFYDADHSDNEDRFLRIGFSAKMNLLVVIFCEDDLNTIRIISARYATKKEREQYEERI